MSKWPEVTVGEIASSARNALVGGPFGSNLVSSDYVDDGVPVIRGQNMGARWVAGEFAHVTEQKAESLSGNLARVGDIVFTQRGTLGQVSLVPDVPFQTYLVSQSQMKLTVNSEIADPLFYYYVFCSPEQQRFVRQNAIQTGVPHTNLGILRKTLVRLPPLREQRAIARILGTLDDKIELNRRMNETLEQMARALFKSWFVDFDPVRAKAEGRDTGLPEHIADLFPDRLVDSELGEIPEGWEVAEVGDLAELERGLSYKGAYLTDEGLPMVNLGCFTGDGMFNIEAIKNYSGEYRRKHVAKPGDLLVANTDITQRRHVLGSPALLPTFLDQTEMLFSHHLYALRLHDDSLATKTFIYLLLLQPAFRERAIGFATGTTVLALPQEAVLGLKFAHPPKDLVEAFCTPSDLLRRRSWACIESSRLLASLRDALLPKLISGELRIADAERLLDGDL